MKPHSGELEATRLAIAWEIVSRSEVNKADPLYAARMVLQVVNVLRDMDYRSYGLGTPRIE